MTDYEHAGEWSCEGCGETFDVESKTDPLLHALSCGSSGVPRHCRHEGFDRRRRELQHAMEAST